LTYVYSFIYLEHVNVWIIGTGIYTSYSLFFTVSVTTLYLH